MHILDLLSNIKRNTVFIAPANHYGSGPDDFKLTVKIEVCAKAFARAKKAGWNPQRKVSEAVNRRVADKLGINSVCYLQHHKDVKRARNGVKTFNISYFISADVAHRLGLKTGSRYHSFDLDTHQAESSNLIKVDFVAKRRVS